MKTKLLFLLIILMGDHIFGQVLYDFDSLITRRFITAAGKEIIDIKVPGKPPGNFRMPIACVPASGDTLPDVPGYDWSFGCSPTAAAMMAGYYDRTGYPNMYTGQTNGGVAPMDNSSWGSVTINGTLMKQCPISATRNGVDGRTTRGHVDDYWIAYNSLSPDPYITNGWTQHPYDDCTADFMFSNQYLYERCDGATGFGMDPSGSPLSITASYGYPDGLFGLTQFFQSRGYSVANYYNQFIYGYQGNTLGFNFTQYKQEINAGRPVLIQLLGHTMLGYGYDDASSTVYLHDTWDYSMHAMMWGGSYSGMQQYGVSVIQLSGSVNIIPTVTTTAVSCYGTNSAISGGIACDGGDTITARGVCWSTFPNPTIADDKTNDGCGEGNFISVPSGLTVNTTFYIRAYATNNIGTGYGLEFSFTTLASPVLSIVNTTQISLIQQSGATSGGIITCDGGAAVTSRGVCWSTSTNPTIADDTTQNGIGMGVFTSVMIGLAANITYHVRAYAANSSGTAYGNELIFTTLSASPCTSMTISHVVGLIAPVNKTVTYGTVTNIPGDPTKCWITGNLGADHQATAVNDATEASAGWYWQFNRKQGYKHDGTTRTPNSAWLTSIVEIFDWQAANDPCVLELGGDWRIPTSSEWTNVDASGNWTNWNGPWNADLKLHAAGSLQYFNGSLSDRGLKGNFWSSSPFTGFNNSGLSLEFSGSYSYVTNKQKAVGSSLRCLKTMCSSYSNVNIVINASANPVSSGTSVTFTATPANGGTSPVYLWKVNGIAAGTNSQTFSYFPVNGDVVTCMLNSNQSCTLGNPAISNPISVTVTIGPSRTLENITVNSGQTKCYNATQTVSVAGNGTTFIVQGGASVTMIAGQNIMYNQGTTVNTGGYMRGYIAPSGPWCLTPSMPSVVNGEAEVPMYSEQSSFKIYPNPTAGNFILEFKGEAPQDKITVTVFGVWGEKVLSAILSGERRHEFSLSDRQAGVYFIRVLSDGRAETARIIKHE